MESDVDVRARAWGAMGSENVAFRHTPDGMQPARSSGSAKADIVIELGGTMNLDKICEEL